ncbi:MAG: MvaI/BcnI restriction endonuclease family protein [Synergistaceae bacterium]|nr:MvaI/BcnI restriction endonuclease family protein [Synergistaceae bacterium]
MSDTTRFTKSTIIAALRNIRSLGWIKNHRNVHNDGAIGNTLEDLLGIEENNLPLPNAAEWELKTQRRNTTALLTLFHLEPSPKALHIADYLLSNYGWRHKGAGTRYPDTEKSFRQTLSYMNPTVRGFFVDIDDNNRRVIIGFDPTKIDDEFADWRDILSATGMMNYDKDYVPYWGFDDLYHKAGVKLGNCFYVSADVKEENGEYFYRYSEIMQLSGFTLDKFLCSIRAGNILIDFDARTGHNHGTKFRIKPNAVPLLYENVRHI